MRYLPPDIAPESVIACLGLISDTHMPDRCSALPSTLADALGEVDMILHMGDVGELWVLDRLSEIAPVVAIHGNDDSRDAQKTLPSQQVISIGGQRIFMCHGHYPDRAEELEKRKDDTWAPKLERWFSLGGDAPIILYGHTHIPMALRRNGAVLINPGALASGGLTTRQTVKTVARMYLRKDGPPVVVHINLAAPEQPFMAEVDYAAGFRAAMVRYSASILEADFAADWPRIEGELRRLAFEVPENAHYVRPLVEVFLRLGWPCWAGEKEYFSRAELLAELRVVQTIPPALRAEIEAAIVGQPQPS